MTESIKLPQPQKDLEFPLMKALELRRTKRKWKGLNLTDQEISNLLWAACGVTQEETKNSKSRRTAPSACNLQEIKVYIALQNGLFLYNEIKHQLLKISSEDIRKHIGTQKMMHSAPLGLIYVSDYSRFKTFIFKEEARKWYTSTADAAFIIQNVYLCCAATNLSTVILSLVNREKLHQIMGLKDFEKVIYTQVVGKSMEE